MNTEIGALQTNHDKVEKERARKRANAYPGPDHMEPEKEVHDYG